MVLLLIALNGCAVGGGEVPGLGSNTRPALAAAMLTTTPAREHEPTPQDLWELHDHLVSCLMTPATCDVERTAEPGTPAWDHLHRAVEQRRASGLTATSHHLPPRRAMLRLWPLAGSWQVELCWVDALVLHDAASDAGRPIIVDDGVLTLAEAWTVRPHDDSWRLVSRQVTRATPGDAPWCR